MTDPGRPAGLTLPRRPWVILLVDDEVDVLSTLSLLLEDSLPGVQVLTVRSGRDGLDLLASERIDAIISDFRMTGMDGIEFLYMACKLRPAIPRLLLTAFGNLDVASRAVEEARVQAFVSKATSPEAFVQQVAALLTYEPPGRPGP